MPSPNPSSSSPSATIHIISKANLTIHKTLTYTPSPSPPLPLSSIRAQISLLAITGNTYTYARGGATLHWWDAYPVPSGPDLSPAEWGIVPTWGFADVVDSTIVGIPVGSRLFGFWPTARMAVDLKLEEGSSEGHWLEVSDERRSLMAMYNRYRLVVPDGSRNASDQEALMAGCAVWQAGWLLSRFIFAAGGSGEIPIHPLGGELSWSRDDADLSRAVVVSLAASSKTGQAFGWAMRKRDGRTDGPLALLEATSNVEGIGGRGGGVSVPSKVVMYSELCDEATLEWMVGHFPRKIVIVDFGATVEIVASLVETIRRTMVGILVMVVGIGAQTKIMSESDVQRVQVVNQDVGRVQMNTSGVIDKAVELHGAGKLFANMDAAWEQIQRVSVYGNQKIEWSEGVGGIEDAWAKLVAGQVSGTSFAAVRM
ncbi:unnamed protein product [Zymoseptoria tritici ST99CH_1A5]|uniref:Uncharacterized protein n=1 Tax=Zymoseptoria tritici ST99CH_1A5 TaxID=1276529 RepID=A0A1Y6L5V1_ZYMTR|nr:unnamed protein product [Zymoseptoria tritici ST99CH_1A5]